MYNVYVMPTDYTRLQVYKLKNLYSSAKWMSELSFLLYISCLLLYHNIFLLINIVYILLVSCLSIYFIPRANFSIGKSPFSMAMVSDIFFYKSLHSLVSVALLPFSICFSFFNCLSLFPILCSELSKIYSRSVRNKHLKCIKQIIHNITSNISKCFSNDDQFKMPLHTAYCYNYIHNLYIIQVIYR